jgi:NAD(P)-dependent dehydrogenase (short-subunit alcohol dehydrogenase family)
MEEFGTDGASQAAVRVFARTWSNELRGRGIRVNAISPGPIDTPAITEAFGDEAPAVKAALGERLAPGRVGRPEEVAAAVAFLAADESSFVVGGNLSVDGGENQGIHLS